MEGRNCSNVWKPEFAKEEELHQSGMTAIFADYHQYVVVRTWYYFVFSSPLPIICDVNAQKVHNYFVKLLRLHYSFSEREVIFCFFTQKGAKPTLKTSKILLWYVGHSSNKNLTCPNTNSHEFHVNPCYKSYKMECIVPLLNVIIYRSLIIIRLYHRCTTNKHHYPS